MGCCCPPIAKPRYRVRGQDRREFPKRVRVIRNWYYLCRRRRPVRTRRSLPRRLKAQLQQALEAAAIKDVQKLLLAAEKELADLGDPALSSLMQ